MTNGLRNALEDFLERHSHSLDIYAFAAARTADGVLFAMGCEPAMEARLQALYPDVRPRWEHGFSGTRWNPEAFAPIQRLEVDASLSELIELVELADFASLDTTSKFIAFAVDLESSEAERKASMRRTVEETRFAAVFPEVVEFERYLADAATWTTGEQAEFWAAAMEELAMQAGTDRAKQLQQLGRTQYDAHDALVALGEAARQPLMRLIRTYVPQRQFNPPGSLERTIHGAISAESKLATAALFGLQAVGADDEQVDVLTRLFAQLDEAAGDGSTNLVVLARVLHALRPERFPEPIVEGGELRNAAAF